MDSLAESCIRFSPRYTSMNSGGAEEEEETSASSLKAAGGGAWRERDELVGHVSLITQPISNSARLLQATAGRARVGYMRLVRGGSVGSYHRVFFFLFFLSHFAPLDYVFHPLNPLDREASIPPLSLLYDVC